MLYRVLTLDKGQRLPLASLSGESVPLDKKSGIGLRGTPGLGRCSRQKKNSDTAGFFSASQLVLLEDGQHHVKGCCYLQRTRFWRQDL